MSDQNNPSTQGPKPVLNVKRQEIHQYSGPIPPPAMLEQYDRVVPCAAARILKMAEDQSAHRQELEKKAIRSDVRNSLLGIIAAFVITLSAFGVVVFTVQKGQAIPATILGSGVIVGLASAFIYGTNSRKQERANKFKQE